MGGDQVEAARAPKARAGALALLVLVMVAITLAGLFLLRGRPAVSDAADVPVWSIAALFGASVLLIVNVPTERERHSVTLSELPLVVALFFLSPVAMVLAQVVGSGLALAIPLRVRGVKLAFNVSQTMLHSLVAVVVFRLILGSAGVESVRALAAAGLAALACDLTSAGLVTLAVWLHSATFQRDTTMFALLVGGAALLGKVAIALLAVIALERHANDGVVLLVFVTGLTYASFRAYALLYLRHQRTAKLYRFTRAVASAVRAADVAEAAIRESRDLLGADAAELLLRGGSGSAVAVGADGVALSRDLAADDQPVLRIAERAAAVVHATTGNAESTFDSWLAARGMSDAIVAPIGDGGTIGCMVIMDRLDGESFGTDDLHLVEAIADQLAVAFDNSRLLEELSAEVREREHRALHDPLTDLANRACFSDAIEAEIHRADESDQLAVLIVALDDFQEINETLGHDHGDAVLLEVASRLRDLAQAGWMPARLGGDEFAILVPSARGIGAATRTAELVVHAFQGNPFHVAGLVIELGIRVGVAVYPDHGTTAQQLLRRAEIALHVARARHAPVSVFLPGDDPHTPRQLVLAHELRRALERNELTVHVQPEVELATRRVVRVEVLARWQREDGTWLAPEEFISVAERTGLIRPLTDYVLEHALEHRRQWAAAGYDIGLAVNCSVRDLVDPAFPEQVAVALTRAVCPASALTLEITETVIMAEPERVASALRRLGILGVQLSIDDFGTGYSSLSSVRALAVDEVKIDRSFVKNAADNEQDGTLVRSITELGHGLGLRVVAEGAEDDRTLDLLHSLGVDIAQGYGIAKPMPAVDLPGWLAARDEIASLDAH